MICEVEGEQVQLLAARAAYLPRLGALLVADLHVGKAEAFQRRGGPVPSGVTAADLRRLTDALSATAATSLWVLGDLVHDEDARDLDDLAQLRARHPDVELHVVRGNHDRHLQDLPPAWGFCEHAGTVELGPFALRHEPEGMERGPYTLCGHLHPMAKVRGAGDELLLPCFHFGQRIGVLPAFTSWSSGVRVDPNDGRTFVVAGDAVVDL